MNAEFNWWLLIVGLVIGGGLVALVLADWTRREADIAADELPLEATWIATVLRDEGVAIDPPTAERVLELHRAYLSSPPPDGAEPGDGDDVVEFEPTVARRVPTAEGRPTADAEPRDEDRPEAAGRP